MTELSPLMFQIDCDLEPLRRKFAALEQGSETAAAKMTVALQSVGSVVDDLCNRIDRLNRKLHEGVLAAG